MSPSGGGPAGRRSGTRAATDARGPSTRGERREGGRHGRPPAAPAETHIRPQLLRLAVLPPVAVALSGCAAVIFAVRSSGVRPGPTMWGVLGGAVSVALAGIVIAAVAADRVARLVHDRLTTLRRSTARREADLRTLVEDLRRGDGPPDRGHRGEPPADADDFDLLAADLTRAHDGAVTAVVQASRLSSQAGSEQKLEVFVNLARRLQSLVHREISILDELENEIEDPDLLKGLFHVDHLATRIRRHAENLAVLGGAVSRRQWSNPVSMTEVLRSAIAEVEQYSRVKLVPPIDGTLRGHAVADVIHLLAELVENATVFSAPHTQVLLRASLVTSGLAVEVEDRGLGMPVGEQERMNALLADPDQVNVASLLADGRIGLFVVSQLAKRHGIHVRLQTNIYGGIQAVLVVPQALLGTEPEAEQAVTTGHGGPVTAAHPGGPAVTAGHAGPGGAPSLAPVSPSAAAPQRPHGAPAGPADSSAPADTGAHAVPPPLPARSSRENRPTPAEARPGISAEDRLVLEENGLQPLTPRGGPVRGTMDKPRLPRRRAQEHIAPQLRDAPAPRQDSEDVAGHDPHLMAAFQRGISLAEAQHQLESDADAPRTTAAMAGTADAPRTTDTVTGTTDRLTGTTDAETGPTDAGTGPTDAGTGPADAGTGSDGTGSVPAADLSPGHPEQGLTAPSRPAPGPALTWLRDPDTTPSPPMPSHTTTAHPMASEHTTPGHTAPGHVAPEHTAPGHMAPEHMAPEHTALDHTAPEHTGHLHTSSPPTNAPAADPHPTGSHTMDAESMGAHPMDAPAIAASSSMGAPSMDAHHAAPHAVDVHPTGAPAPERPDADGHHRDTGPWDSGHWSLDVQPAPDPDSPARSPLPPTAPAQPHLPRQSTPEPRLQPQQPQPQPQPQSFPQPHPQTPAPSPASSPDPSTAPSPTGTHPTDHPRTDHPRTDPAPLAAPLPSTPLPTSTGTPTPYLDALADLAPHPRDDRPAARPAPTHRQDGSPPAG
ncbi:ATP-binding protein [Streptomyces sp. bgisy022]|uniref:sensor histidine kinase n=1 Tax=Streptomyces sp. bgisy022 TaxID=3413769 RepID=UPI003D734F8C